jgi:hypothetical protein
MSETGEVRREAASFRDPTGFVFRRDGEVYRQVNASYQADYDRFMGSGLYDKLVASGRLVQHTEVPLTFAAESGAYKVLKPHPLPFISHPYEWCFGQLKDAALLTLDIQEEALSSGMSLKDASAYNIQFFKGRPLFIDTLSFETLEEGRPWVAYRQFCQHFLAPLALLSRTDARLGQLSRVHLDGIPLDLASRLLPGGTKFTTSLGLHIHAHARSQRRHESNAQGVKHAAAGRFSKTAFLALIASLRNAVHKQTWNTPKTEWADYYDANHNYGDKGLEAKSGLVESLLRPVQPRSTWDLGANTGVFSRVAAKLGAHVVAWDIDSNAVEANYQRVRREQESSVLPLLLDLTNPSPGLGWAHGERASLVARGPVDVVMALGLIHHLAISNNVPLGHISRFFASLGHHVLVEWVPKEDSQVEKLLATRKDVFPHYHREGFQAAFAKDFDAASVVEIPGTRRALYLFKRR